MRPPLREHTRRYGKYPERAGTLTVAAACAPGIPRVWGDVYKGLSPEGATE
ncbi:MAG: hypothetical protein LBS79_01170 [Tannerella sp.]|nr:hypothetical protein [Tannerella sp.]